MKLDKKYVHKRRVDLLAVKKGIEFIVSTEIGKDLPAKNLLKILIQSMLCCGATKPSDLPVEGRELEWCSFCNGFFNQEYAGTVRVKDITAFETAAKGKDAVVIGGGDTGTDCVGTSLRHGCNKSITQLEIMPRPPDERADDNPWPEWPKYIRWIMGKKKQKKFLGLIPEITLQQPKKFIGDENGNLTAVLSFMK